MGDKVRNLVSGYIEELAAKDGPKMVTFSIRMSEHENARLIWLAKKLDAQKPPLAEKLLSAAVGEAIEQYAGWASENPHEFLKEAPAEIQELGSKPHYGPKPPHHKPPGPGPEHPK